MKIKQFEDKYLSHYSYAILSECTSKLIIIDPSRNPQPYYDYAKAHGAEICGVIETHPHADFISSHLEIHLNTGCPIYASKQVKPLYPFTAFDEGDEITIGKIKLQALNTPGHSPDSICIVLEHGGREKALFSGDTLFIGDCGRPDLRESGGTADSERRFLAGQMYHSLRDKLMRLGDEVILYPAHGAGTLCGKQLSEANSSTIGKEKQDNWSLQQMSKNDFIKALTSDQPFIPAYFSFNVELNKKGAPNFMDSVNTVPIIQDRPSDQAHIWIIDSRNEQAYKANHQTNSINLMVGTKFETWLGSIIKPGEEFYLRAEDKTSLVQLIARTASIGYEQQLKGGYFNSLGSENMDSFDLEYFKSNEKDYTILDVRNGSEIKNQKIFARSIAIPLGELRDRLSEIPTDKPIAVHCAGGYRSAAASSMIKSALNAKIKVVDIGELIKEFAKEGI